jgi:lipoate-protein ligase A
LSAYFIGVILLGGGIVFLIELALFFSLLIPVDYFAISLSSFTSFTGFISFISYLGIYLTIYFGGYLG